MKRLIPFLVLFFLIIFTQKTNAMTEISGDLQVTYDNPLFPPSVIWYPGLSVTKSFTVKNIGSAIHPVSIKAVNILQSGDIGQVYLFKITEGETTIYGVNNDKTMKNFWDDGQIGLSNLAGGTSTTYNMIITMTNLAGNLYQGKLAKFDLIIGFAGTVSQVTVSGGTTGGGATPTPTPTSIATPTPIAEVLGSKISQELPKTDTIETREIGTVEGEVAGAKTPIVSWPIIALGGVGIAGGATALYLFLKKGKLE